MSDVPSQPPFELPAAELKHSVRRSAVAIAVAQLASQAISLVGVAILLRLLMPAEYGLVGMILPLVTFLRIFATLGLNVATVQRAVIRPDEVSSLFWLNLLLGCATAGVAAVIAPYLGDLYAKPEAATVLRDLTWALAGTSLLAAIWRSTPGALGAAHAARFAGSSADCGAVGRHDRGSRGGARGLGCVGAGLAAIRRVWIAIGVCLVDGIVATDIALCGAQIGSHLRLGGYFAAASVAFYLADNLDRVMVGRLVGPEAVGLYGQAYNIMIKPVYVVITPLVALVLTSLARAANQPETRQELIVAYYRLLAVLLLPAAVGLVVTGGDVMRLLGGTAWTDAGPLLSVLAVGMFGQAMIILGVPILTAADRGGKLLAAAMVVAAILCTAYSTGWYFGQQRGEPVLGVAWGYAIATLAMIAPTLYLVLCTNGWILASTHSAIARAPGGGGNLDGNSGAARRDMAASRIFSSTIGGLDPARCDRLHADGLARVALAPVPRTKAAGGTTGELTSKESVSLSPHTFRRIRAPTARSVRESDPGRLR